MTKKIVVIEDDEDFLTLVRLMLVGEAVEVIVAASGVAGLEAIRQHQPDLVLLDLTLPDMHGWEVFMAMRDDATLPQPPVIIISSEGTRYDQSFSRNIARVHEYLTKPFLPSRLRASVASALGLPPSE